MLKEDISFPTYINNVVEHDFQKDALGFISQPINIPEELKPRCKNCKWNGGVRFDFWDYCEKLKMCNGTEGNIYTGYPAHGPIAHTPAVYKKEKNGFGQCIDYEDNWVYKIKLFIKKLSDKIGRLIIKQH